MCLLLLKSKTKQFNVVAWITVPKMILTLNQYVPIIHIYAEPTFHHNIKKRYNIYHCHFI